MSINHKVSDQHLQVIKEDEQTHNVIPHGETLTCSKAEVPNKPTSLSLATGRAQQARMIETEPQNL
jgi:hypothetical protein